MNKKKLIIIISSVIALFFLTSLTYKCIKNYCMERDETVRYEKALKPNNNKDNPFASKAQLSFYDSVLSNPAIGIKQFTLTQYFKAMSLIKLGKEKDAIEILQAIVQRTNKKELVAKDAQKYLALAYLRLAERNNCIMNHSSGSCIFPIKDKGVYMDLYASQKAIEAYQQILQGDSSDLESRWLLNLAYMTVGEYPQKVPANLLIAGLDKDTSSYKVKAFQDMAGDLGTNHFRSMAGGVIVDDFNNDGYLDIVTSSWSLDEPMHYFKNNADGTFTDLSEKSGLSKIKGGLNIIQADYNNDGYTDILVIRGAWLGEFGKQPNTLLRNNGDGTFTDVTVESGILSFGPSQAAVWADFNNDGWLDLFVAKETRDMGNPNPGELFINNHDGTFSNVSSQAKCDEVAFCKGVTVADYNNDGWPDIFISTLDNKKILLKNKGVKSKIPQFENVTDQAGLGKNMSFTFPTWFWDYNNDGWPDIFICGYDFNKSLALTAASEALNIKLPENTSKMYLFKNNRDGTFTDVSKNTGLDKPVFAMGSNFGDMDNDGWSDMYLGTGNPDFKSLIPNRMFKNIEGKKFAEVTSSARVGNLQKGHAVAFADVDNDGDQDIFIEVGGAYPGDAYYNSFYINPGQNDNNWISILLEGTKSNRSAIGAHIAVSFTDDTVKRTVYMDVNSGGSFGSNPLRKEIGIGKAKMIDELIIKWPTTGVVQVFKNIQPCQFLKIREGNEQIEKMNLKKLTFKRQQNNMNMQMQMISCAPAIKQ
jgi:tetratricopeptide (TPR) repeat protein